MEICNFEQPAGDLGSFLVAAHTVNTEFGAISNFFLRIRVSQMAGTIVSVGGQTSFRPVFLPDSI